MFHKHILSVRILNCIYQANFNGLGTVRINVWNVQPMDIEWFWLALFIDIVNVIFITAVNSFLIFM